MRMEPPDRTAEQRPDLSIWRRLFPPVLAYRLEGVHAPVPSPQFAHALPSNAPGRPQLAAHGSVLDGLTWRRSLMFLAADSCRYAPGVCCLGALHRSVFAICSWSGARWRLAERFCRSAAWSWSDRQFVQEHLRLASDLESAQSSSVWRMVSRRLSVLEEMTLDASPVFLAESSVSAFTWMGMEQRSGAAPRRNRRMVAPGPGRRCRIMAPAGVASHVSEAVQWVRPDDDPAASAGYACSDFV